MTVTSSIAAEVVETAFEDIPAAAVNQVKDLFVDQVGISFMGHHFTGDALAKYVAQAAGPEEALLLGPGVRSPVELAAGFNAQMAQNAGMENTGPGLHAGPLVTHTAFAVAQRAGASGQDMLAAMAIGYDLNARFHLARTADEDVRHMNMVAAAIASRLLSLDVDHTATALSLAWEFPMRQRLYLKPKTPKRVSVFPMGHLFTARAGVQAALMADNGFATLGNEIDELGDEYNLDALADRSDAFGFVSNGLFLKPWVSSHLCHMVLQLISEMMDANDLEPGDITAIKVGLPHIYTIPHQNDPAPNNYWEAIYSVQWGISMIAHRVAPGPEWVTPQRLGDSSARALATMIEVVEYPPSSAALEKKDFLAIEGWVELETASNSYSGSKTMAQTHGSPTTPMTEEMLSAKFRRVTEPSLGADGAQAAWNAVKEVESYSDVGRLAAHLTAN